MDPDAPRDTYEKCLRFGCGFLLGAVVAFPVMFVALHMPIGLALWLLILACALACGFVAAVAGDYIWNRIVWLFSKFW